MSTLYSNDTALTRDALFPEDEKKILTMSTLLREHGMIVRYELTLREHEEVGDFFADIIVANLTGSSIPYARWCNHIGVNHGRYCITPPMVVLKQVSPSGLHEELGQTVRAWLNSCERRPWKSRWFFGAKFLNVITKGDGYPPAETRHSPEIFGCFAGITLTLMKQKLGELEKMELCSDYSFNVDSMQLLVTKYEEFLSLSDYKHAVRNKLFF